jgi:hypothetical protein
VAAHPKEKVWMTLIEEKLLPKLSGRNETQKLTLTQNEYH